MPGSGHNGLVGTLLGRLVAWIREGYPTGVPERDYVPLMALLRRRLTDKEVKQVSRALVRSRTLPADAIDIGVGITKVTDDMPSPADVQRVRRRLKKKGWPTDFPARAKPVRRAGQATAKADTSGAAAPGGQFQWDWPDSRAGTAAIASRGQIQWAGLPDPGPAADAPQTLTPSRRALR